MWRLVVAAALVVGAACGGGGETSASHDEHAHGDTKAQFDKADADTVVEVDAADFRFDRLPASVQGPNVYFTVNNVGNAEHELMVMGDDGEPVGQVAGIAKGTTKTLAVKLPAATYTVECRIKEGNATHADLGMKNTLTVT